MKRFIVENKITVFHFGIHGNKEPLTDMPEDVIREVLIKVLGRTFGNRN